MHRPQICWSLRRNLKDYVRTTPDDGIAIYIGGHYIETDRATARLLAKRISQCLDETTARAIGRIRPWYR